MCSDCREQLDFKDTELQMLVVSLKEPTATKEVIQTVEQLLCDDTSQLEEERSQVSTLFSCLKCRRDFLRVWSLSRKQSFFSSSST